MPYKSRSGLNLTLAFALAFAISGCGTSDLVGVDQGKVRFVLSGGDFEPISPASSVAEPDATATTGEPMASSEPYGEHGDHDRPHIQSLNLTFSSILARNLDGVLVDVAMELPATVDVMLMEEGRQIVLPDGELPPATYDQLVVVMTAVSVVTGDGTRITVEPPGGGWTAIVPVCPFTVEEGSTAVVGLEFGLRQMLRFRDGRFWFHPHLRCETPTVMPDGP